MVLLDLLVNQGKKLVFFQSDIFNDSASKTDTGGDCELSSYSNDGSPPSPAILMRISGTVESESFTFFDSLLNI